MRMVFYVFFYGFLGYALERVINLVVRGFWFDNRVITLPVQPMYGLGVVLALAIYAFMERHAVRKRITLVILFPVAILTTAFSEWISGEGYHLLSGSVLWDYSHTFSFCQYPYVCLLPTALFGILSALTVLFVHPFIESWSDRLPQWLISGVVFLVGLDMAATYILMLT